MIETLYSFSQIWSQGVSCWLGHSPWASWRRLTYPPSWATLDLLGNLLSIEDTSFICLWSTNERHIRFKKILSFKNGNVPLIIKWQRIVNNILCFCVWTLLFNPVVGFIQVWKRLCCLKSHRSLEMVVVCAAGSRAKASWNPALLVSQPQR